MRLRFTYLLFLILLFYKGFTVSQQQKSHSVPCISSIQINNNHSPALSGNESAVILSNNETLCNEFEDEDEDTVTRKKTLPSHFNTELNNNYWSIHFPDAHTTALSSNRSFIYLPAEKYIFQRVLRI